MRRLAVATILVGLAGWAGAVDPTTELLHAPRVRSDVRIVLPDGDGPPRVELDKKGLTYEEPLSIVASDELAFVVSNYNPLTMEIKAEAVESEDPNAAQLEKFVNAFLGTFAKVSGAESTQTGSALARQAEAQAASACPEAIEAANQLILFDQAVRKARIDAASVKGWVKNAVGRRGMAGVADSMGAQAVALQEQAAHAKEALGNLEKLRERLEATSRSAKLEATDQADRSRELAAAACPREVLAQLTIFFRTEPEADLERIGRLAQATQELADSLAKVASDDNRWDPPHSQNSEANERSKDYVFQRQAPKSGKVVTVTVSARRLTLEAKPDSLVRAEVPKSARKLEFRLREYARFAPELGAGLVVSGVKTPTYRAVAGEGGQTVVVKSAVEPRDLKGALLLNAVCRCWGPAFFHPMLQFGLAADDATPAVLAGLGFRFTRPKGLGLSAGGVLAWVKDLDQLAIGGPVKDQAQIDADLKAQPTVRPYFAVQFTF